MSAPTKLRLFVAVVPDPPLLERVAALLTRLRSAADRAGWRVGWVPPRNLHLTLKFLGWVPPEAVPAIDGALRPVAARTPFQIQLRGVGAFPPQGRPRVIWVGVQQGADDLVSLAQSVEAALETIGFSREGRAFHPHLTLGRVKTAAGPRDRVLHGFEDTEVGSCHVREIIVHRSVLKQPHPDYEPHLRIPLTAS